MTDDYGPHIEVAKTHNAGWGWNCARCEITHLHLEENEAKSHARAHRISDQHRASQPRAGRVPGWEGSIGPFPRQYNDPHVYARDVHSGAGKCVCGRGLGDTRHVQAAPGVPVPDEMRWRKP